MPYSRERRCEAASLKHARLHETPVLQFQHHIAVSSVLMRCAIMNVVATSHETLCRLQDGCFSFHVDRTSWLIEKKNGSIFQETLWLARCFGVLRQKDGSRARRLRFGTHW